MAVHAPDSVVRTGLLSCLRQDRRLSEVDTAAGAGEADVVVVAVETADHSTLETLRGLRADSGAPCLVVVKRQWRIGVRTAVECGVRAVLWHAGFSSQEFAFRILALTQGGESLPHTLEDDLTDQVRGPGREASAPTAASPLRPTERERSVLQLLAEGLELAKIAKELSYSERTIKYTLYGVMKRLGLHNRAHAVSYAIRTGLI